MVLGIGIDVVNISRIDASIERYEDRFLSRVFTSGEQTDCVGRDAAGESFAGRFAAKEAVFKALGAGWDVCGGFTSVEVVREQGGRPRIVLHGRAKERARQLGADSMYVSITHDAGIAAAVVVIEG